MTLALVNLAAQDTPLPMPWSRIKRTLDSFEARFVRGGLRLQQARVDALRPVVERALRSGLVPASIRLEGSFQDLVEAYVGQVLVEGIVQGDADVRAEERRARAAGVNLKVDGEPVVPKEALEFIASRRDLNRFFDGDQVEKVRTILGNSIREGATVKQTMDALQTALPAASKARLENIARTEATAAYNQGRVVRFLQSKGFIQAVRFDAILDSRVTDICEHRNGLLFALDDPRLRQNAPPLHYQCRSVLSPISGYKLEKLGGKARLDADRAKMDEAPGPQVTKKGRFGNEPWPDVQGGGAAPRAKPVGPKAGPGRAEPGPRAEAEPVRTPSGPKEPARGGEAAGPVRTPERASPGNVSSHGLPVAQADHRVHDRYDRLPDPDSGDVLLTTPLTVGRVTFPVIDHWEGTTELVIMRDVLHEFPERLLQRLEHVRFTSDRLNGEDGSHANALYIVGAQRIELSRDASRDFARFVSQDQWTRARTTIAHELAHHAYDSVLDTKDLALWIEAHWDADLGILDIRKRREQFAYEFGLFIGDRREFTRILGVLYPNLEEAFLAILRRTISQ